MQAPGLQSLTCSTASEPLEKVKGENINTTTRNIWGETPNKITTHDLLPMREEAE
jgi:hypothetical protein